MNILLIDHSGMQLDTRKALLEDAVHCTIDTATSLTGIQVSYRKGYYDVVIIDHMIENGQEGVDYILNIDSMQKILVVSDAPKCVIHRCETCVQEHSIHRFNNPTPIRNIIRMVLEFDNYTCDHYDPSTN